jgi:hypothetical protein
MSQSTFNQGSGCRGCRIGDRRKGGSIRREREMEEIAEGWGSCHQLGKT